MSIFDQKTVSYIPCCLCGTTIPPNPSNMCISCIRGQVDITEGIPKQVYCSWCKGCGRYLSPPNFWLLADLESKELLTFCLKRIKGLKQVKLVDAGFVYTEPHSKRLKVKLTVQKEVFNGTILQQVFVVEIIIQNNFCPDCHKVEAKDMWSAKVQLRQKVEHKRTFLWLEQLILKHQAHVNAVNTTEQPDGIDFYFHTKSHAMKFIQFMTSMVPMKYSDSKQLVSHDIRSNEYTYKYTFIAEVAPVCKDDLVCLSNKMANQLGAISNLVLCHKISNQIYLIDPFTLQTATINSVYWQAPFRSIQSREHLTDFMVLDIEPIDRNNTGRFCLAEAEVARLSDFGRNDRTYFTVTHLGNVLEPGDTCSGYDMSVANFNDDDVLPLRGKSVRSEIVIVRKTYPLHRKLNKKRKFRLARLKMQHSADAAKKFIRDRHERNLEEFIRDLEEDPELRSMVNLYKGPGGSGGAVAEPMGGDDMELDEEDVEPDFPEPDVEELVDLVDGLELY
eukprot:TRINITY_DN329_c0_g1_i1.p1 TRINITY_DN329_c0_g1~~TRINITY_DN329_c0_g1_i1.p1  ORF type:complete len:572 (+),score=119.55 TRINITY_DN329_c0_g1_i1:206-1717(+)